MEIREEEKILEEASKYQEIVVYGKRSLVNTLCRYLKKNNVPVSYVSYDGNQKKQGSFLNIPISSMRGLESQKEFCLVFVALDRTEKRISRVNGILSKYGFQNVVYLSYELLSELGTKENVHLDFICTGFAKCGTTSLHVALKKNKQVFLPKRKEIRYLRWRDQYEDAPDRFKNMYYADTKEGQIVGNIEAGYHEKYEGVYECYGRDVKIIFMVRNPADATYSYFKMLMRRTSHKKQVNYYRKYFNFNVKMFDDYIRDYIITEEEDRFQYIKYIKKYEEYFGRENIKIVFMEELIRNTEEVMDDIQAFIGVEPKKYESLPHSNEGKEVSKNYICACINRNLHRKDLELIPESRKKKKRFQKYKNFWYKHTLAENREKMAPESRETLNEFYKESIHRLEEFCGKSAEGIWY